MSGSLQDALGPMLALIAALPDGFLAVNGAGEIVLSNPQAEALFGYSREELLGKSVETLLPESVRKIHSRHRDSFFAAPKMRAMGSGLELFGRRKDGSEFPVDINLSAMEIGSERVAIAIVRDITERKESEAALRTLNADLERAAAERAASEARYSMLFHSTDEGYCIVEMIFDEQQKPVDYRFIEINPAFEKHTGLSNALGKTMRELAPDHEEHWFETYGRIALDGEAIRFQNHAVELNRFYDVYACRIGDPEDRLVAILFNDITEKRHMEAALIEAKERAETASFAKSEFLSRMSHELRTPMNSILGYAQLLDLQYDDPRIREATRSIMKGGRHLLHLINEVLDLSRIESGSLSVSIEPTPLAEVLHQAISVVLPIAESAGVRLSIENDICETMHVEADQQRLLQTFINLLNNAIKYNHQDGQIAIRCREAPDGVRRIEISDTGPGIPPIHQELLFQPFQRFGDLAVEGTGLGLALSHRFVKLMGGTLGLSESTAAGSTFYIELKASSPTDRQPRMPTEILAVSMATRAGKVLYIEDNLSNVSLFKDVFARWKHVDLIPALQGRVGVELARLHQPDLILLDVHLPDTTGDKVLEQLKADPATRAIPVVVISADATKRQVEALLAGGAEDYLTKPIDLQLLFKALEKHLPR